MCHMCSVWSLDVVSKDLQKGTSITSGQDQKLLVGKMLTSFAPKALVRAVLRTETTVVGESRLRARSSTILYGLGWYTGPRPFVARAL